MTIGHNNQATCQQCGAELLLAPSGRRKRFCSNACRQAAFRNETTGKSCLTTYDPGDGIGAIFAH